jgi:signal transduction histidine kinase
MMHEFLTANRSELIERCRGKVAQRDPAGAVQDELTDGISPFLDQLIKTLQVEQTLDPRRSRKVSGPDDGGHAASEIGETAARHGRELLQNGFTIDQVVHDYGDLCQAITDLSFESQAPIATDEFRTLNRCLDNAIAGAVTEFNYQRDFLVADFQAHSVNERLGVFAHELRNLVNSATLALTAIKAGTVGLTGATGAVLDRSLVGLRILIDRSLTEVRMTAGMPVQHQMFGLADFIAELKVSGTLEAQLKECALTVSHVDSGLAVDADREMLLSAVGNLLQNAFEFTHLHTEVSLSAYAVADRILIEVEDHCGGLADDQTENMFLPFSQNGEDRSGLGLGLSISRRSVEANDGTLTVRDLPGDGCIFTIDLPRHSVAEVLPLDALSEKIDRLASIDRRSGKKEGPD